MSKTKFDCCLTGFEPSTAHMVAQLLSHLAMPSDQGNHALYMISTADNRDHLKIILPKHGSQWDNIVLGGSPSSPMGPHSPGRLWTRVPILPGEWGPGVPISGCPHSPLTPALACGLRKRLRSFLMGVTIVTPSGSHYRDSQ